MKVDIEGTDEAALARLFSSGALCTVDYVYVEHIRPDRLSFFNEALAHGGCKTIIEWVDDEAFHEFKPV